MSSAPLQLVEELWLKRLRLQQVYDGCMNNWMFKIGSTIIAFTKLDSHLEKSQKHVSPQTFAYNVPFLFRFQAAPRNLDQVAVQITMKRGVKRSTGAARRKNLQYRHIKQRTTGARAKGKGRPWRNHIHFYAEDSMSQGSARTPLDWNYPFKCCALHCKCFQLQAKCLADGDMLWETPRDNVISTCKENLNSLSTRPKLF